MDKRFTGDYENFQRFNEEHKITYCDLEAEVWEAEELLKEKDAEIERLTGVIALDCKIMEESSDKLKAAEQKIVEKDMEISKLKEGILLLREQLTNPRR